MPEERKQFRAVKKTAAAGSGTGAVGAGVGAAGAGVGAAGAGNGRGVVSAANVGRQLLARRQQMGLPLPKVEAETKIRGRFLMMLESGDYAGLPNDIYSRGFVQHYATYLGLDGAALAAAYTAERGGVSEAATQRERFERPRRVISTGPIIAGLAAAGAIFGLLGYILVQMSVLAAAPQLAVSAPAADVLVSGSQVTIVGRATPGSDVSINDSPIYTDNDGVFSEKVALQEGVNAIHITAKSKLGKSTTVTRNILAKYSQIDTVVAVPATTFDGVAVAITVKATAEIIVKVDGQEKFRGLMLTGKSRLFSGAQNVTVTTSNAGATALVVTNKMVANKHLDNLGADGQAKADLIFAKDTNIQ